MEYSNGMSYFKNLIKNDVMKARFLCTMSRFVVLEVAESWKNYLQNQIKKKKKKNSLFTIHNK